MTEPTTPLSPLDRVPAEIHCAQDYEGLAPRFLSAASYAYIAGGSGQEVTVEGNRSAYARWAIQPRLLHDVTAGHTDLALPGSQALAHPFLLAPVAYQRLAHPRGELESARAAAATDTTLVCSTLASQSLEDVASLSGHNRWFQLYLQPRRDDTLSLLRRAEAAGYAAIVLTFDATIQVPSLRALGAGFRLPDDCVAVNLRDAGPAAATAVDNGRSRIFQGLMRRAPTWAELDWLQAQTRLPVWVKGVLHPDDARALQARGVAGVVVSNHGGRSLDGVPASLLALPAVRAAVGESYPLLFDGGIRSGADAFKALALGADAVLLGRLQVYALSVAGALGLAHAIKLLREELEVCMAVAGCATLADIGPAALMPLPSV